MSTDSSVAVTDATGATVFIDNGERTTGAGTVKTQRVEVIHSDISTGSTVGPASYASGGFVVDLTATFSQIDFFHVAVTTVGPNLPPCHYEYALNSPSNGKVTVKVMRHRYDRLTSVDNLSGQPSGVTVRSATAGVTTSSTGGTATTAASAASVDAIGGSGVAQNANHQHAHTHTFNEIWQHQHGVTQAQTNAASVELPAATDLSSTTWRYLAVGQ